MSHFERNYGFGASLDDIVNAAREFGEKMKEMGPELGSFWFDPAMGCHGRQGEGPRMYFYPPTNSYKKEDGSLVFEFALAGFSESAVSISFQGDDLVLSAKAPERDEDRSDSGYWHHGFKPRNIEKQKYPVPADDYIQEEAKAVFKNGVLTVTVPAKECAPGIKIEIVKEGN
jgi:Molecular chaperone (small heat shock protein)